MTKKSDFTKAVVDKLVDARHAIGIYSIEELMSMFECGRYHIDNATNTNCLRHISPNNRDRYYYLEDFVKYMEKVSEGES